MKYTLFILIVVVAILFTKSMAMAQSTEFMQEAEEQVLI